MSQVIQAIYEDGVLKPLEKVVLGERQKVQITIEPAPGAIPCKPERVDPLEGLRTATGIRDLAENFDEYRLGSQKK
jgi:predicted DNA-binding antitoxin AbrB/MazE fold protein